MVDMRKQSHLLMVNLHDVIRQNKEFEHKITCIHDQNNAIKHSYSHVEFS